MKDDKTTRAMSARQRREAWGRFRFGVIAPLLTSPPESGERKAALQAICTKTYEHPLSGEPMTVGFSTVEAWYYTARSYPDDPLAALARKRSARAGQRPAMSAALVTTLERQYREHPGWSKQLHHKNLLARIEDDRELGEAPSYATVCRLMAERGWLRRPKRKRRQEEASAFVPRERRSYEVEHVMGLVHADFHQASRSVLLPDGSRIRPMLVGFLDDRSRLCLHLQWYLAESAEVFVHGLIQAILKRGLFRSLLTDNGKAMLAAEVTQGLERLGIVHHTTLPYSPEQNGKQEHFWSKVEGQLLPMLEGEPGLTLTALNRATQAWVELDYHRTVHRELGKTPLQALIDGPTVWRPSPSFSVLQERFRMEMRRSQRRSDGSVTVGGVRFEVPSAYRHWRKLDLHVARWDLSHIGLLDPHTGARLTELYPLDKHAHADGKRRVIDQASSEPSALEPTGIAPHLRSLLQRYEQTALAPAYLPHDIEGFLSCEEAAPLEPAPATTDPDHTENTETFEELPF